MAPPDSPRELTPACPPTSTCKSVLHEHGPIAVNDLVRVFKRALNDPANKAQNREEFRMIIDRISSITDESTLERKVLRLKPEYAPRKEPHQQAAPASFAPAPPAAAPAPRRESSGLSVDSRASAAAELERRANEKREREDRQKLEEAAVLKAKQEQEAALKAKQEQEAAALRVKEAAALKAKAEQEAALRAKEAQEAAALKAKQEQEAASKAKQEQEEAARRETRAHSEAHAQPPKVIVDGTKEKEGEAEPSSTGSSESASPTKEFAGDIKSE